MIRNKSLETIKESIDFFLSEQRASLDRINNFLRHKGFSEEEIDDFICMMGGLAQIMREGLK